MRHTTDDQSERPAQGMDGKKYVRVEDERDRYAGICCYTH